jgi:tetratricopeptide (TPR) repeat protein
MGNALLALGRAHDAAIQYETAARWWPEKREVYRKKLDAFFAQQAAHPTEAMRLYGQAVTLEHSQVGPLLPEVLDLLHKAVTLEPKNVVIRRELVRVLFERQERERGDAIREARALLALSPDDTVGHALLAVLLVNSDTDVNLDEVQYHLNQAKADPTMASVVYYGAGRLALRRNQSDAALVALRTARRLAPDSDPICYALAQAEHLYGSKEIADRLFKEYAQRRAKKSEEVELLRSIGQNPDQPTLYRKAITFYQQNGQVAQAAAIQREFQRRFKAVP